MISSSTCSTTERPISYVSDVERTVFTRAQLFNDIDTGSLNQANNDSLLTVNWRSLMDHMKKEGRLEYNAALELIKRTTEILKDEPNIIHYKPPLILVGDIHGQYFDLIALLEIGGDPETTPYLFLGDFVDRGAFGVEVIFLLYALKLSFPRSIHLIRGNHECRLLTSHFSFKREVIKKYKNEELYDAIMESFDALPLGLLLESSDARFLCLHGGLSPDLPTIDSMQAINRFKEPGKKGPLCDILWSDPLEEDTADGLEEDEMQEWFDVDYVENPTRGCGYVFGYTAVSTFLETNNLTSILRAHEVQRQGYGLNHFNKKDLNHPLVVTLFSAPNYCDFYQNQAAIMKVVYNHAEKKTNIEFIQYESVDHPFWLPSLQDGIEYTTPFLLDRLGSICKYLCSTIDLDEETEEEKEFYGKIESELTKIKEGNASGMLISTPRKSGIRKVPTLYRPAKEFLTIADRIKMLEQTVKESSNKKLIRTPSGVRHSLVQMKILHSKRKNYLKTASTPFDKARQADVQNERIPDVSIDKIALKFL